MTLRIRMQRLERAAPSPTPPAAPAEADPVDWAAVTDALLAAAGGLGEPGDRLEGPSRAAFADLLPCAGAVKSFMDGSPLEWGGACA